MASYPLNSFMLISVDNLDFKHSFARIYSGTAIKLAWNNCTIVATATTTTS